MKKGWKAAAIGFIILLIVLICLRNRIWNFWNVQSQNIFQEYTGISEKCEISLCKDTEEK